MVKAQPKQLWKSVKELTRSIPDNALTFKHIDGMSSKGRFNIWSFRDESGKLIEREIWYNNGGNLTKYVRHYEYNSELFNVAEIKYCNNEVASISNKAVIFGKAKKCKDAWMYDIKFGGNVDSHKISYLSPGQKPQYVSYDTFWNGEKPSNMVIKSKTDKNLPVDNLEYLPLIGDFDGFGHTVDSKINHISKIQERKYGLEGITPPVKRVPKEELANVEKDGTERGAADCNMFNGQIRIKKEEKNSRTLLNHLGHEYRHAYDGSNVMRLEENVNDYRALSAKELEIHESIIPGTTNFTEKSINKGIIPQDSNLGKEVQTFQEKCDWNHDLPHDDRYQEWLANEAGEEEVGKLDKLISSLRDIFSAKFWWAA